MSRRMADDLKRIIGIDNKSRPLEKRDPLPRVMGGYGVSIIEGETQTVEPVVAAMPDVYVAFESNGIRLNEENEFAIASGSGFSTHTAFTFNNSWCVHSENIWFLDDDGGPVENKKAVIKNNGTIMQSFGLWYDDYAFGDSGVTSTKDYLWIAASYDSMQSLQLLKCDPMDGSLIESIMIDETTNAFMNYQVKGICATENYIHIAGLNDNGNFHVLFDISAGSWIKTEYPWASLSFGPEVGSAYGDEVCFVVQDYSLSFNTRQVWILPESGNFDNATKISQPVSQSNRMAGAGITEGKIISTFRSSNEIQIYDRVSGIWTSLGDYGFLQGAAVTSDPSPIPPAP